MTSGRAARASSFHRFVVLAACVAALASCNGSAGTGGLVSACVTADAQGDGSATIAGGLYFAHTIGAVTGPGPTWRDGVPRAGTVHIEGERPPLLIKLRTARDGFFQCAVPPGRYRVSGFIPGVHEQGYTDEPMIAASQSVDAIADSAARVHLLIYEWDP
jgi:hypothetical protein